MALLMEEKRSGRVMELHVSGKLTPDDYKAYVPQFERLIQQYGKIRLLFDMKDFHGWEMGAVWEDLKFVVKHFNDIEKIAMVGEKRWERGMAAFCRPFTTAKIRYFDASEITEARNWIDSD